MIELGLERLWLMFTGTGDADTTYDAIIYRWRRVRLSTTTQLYVPIRLCTLTCTLSAAIGVASSVFIATDRMVDTIANKGGATNNTGDYTLWSPAGDEVACMDLACDGFQYAEIVFDLTGATAANVAWAKS